MNKQVFASVAGLALVASVPAWGQANKASNTSTVTQDGNAESATINQIGSNDISIVSQNDSTSDHNVATVHQNGVSGGKSTITQSGSTNTAVVTTADDGSLYDVTTNPPGTFAKLPITVSTVTQSGDHNTTTVDQKSQYNASQSASTVLQSASTNTATVTQRDDSQSSSVMQTSGNNTAIVTQGVDDPAGDATWGNSSTINQIGTIGGNYARVTQTGEIDGSSVTQSGSNGQAIVIQHDATLIAGAPIATASRNSSRVTQSADSNIALITQVGERNSSTVTSSKDGNDARVTQTGNDNTSTVSQSAPATGTLLYFADRQILGINSLPDIKNNFAAFAGVQQTGYSLESHIDQSGQSDFAWVSQVDPTPFGATDVSNVIQSGIGVEAAIQQIGSGLSSSLKQSGTNDFAAIDQQGSNNSSNWTQSGETNNSRYTAALLNAGLLPFAGFDNSILGVHQSGTGQTSTITQSGSRSDLLVIQSNQDNTSTINQDGTYNAIRVTQTGTGNTSEVDQLTGSSLGTVTLFQDTANNYSLITQGAGTGSVAAVTQH